MNGAIVFITEVPRCIRVFCRSFSGIVLYFRGPFASEKFVELILVSLLFLVRPFNLPSPVLGLEILIDLLTIFNAD
jgi:hypothetical protein